MFIIVGLGNPGEEYKNTRHNVGFIVLDHILGKKDWEESTKANTLYKKIGTGKKEIEYLKPLTFMNKSGSAVSYAAKKHNVKPDHVVVIHDELDLPIGRMKISFNKSSGGHNGLESIIKSVKSQEFVRIRVGISPHTPSGKIKKPSGEKPVIDFLLKNFKDSEMTDIKKLSKKISAALDCFVAEGKDKMMSLYN